MNPSVKNRDDELVLPPAAEPATPGEALRAALPEGWADMLVDQAAAEGVALLGPHGLVAQFTSQLLEAGLRGEMSEHLGYEPHAVEGRGSGNSRNGSYAKTVHTEHGVTSRRVSASIGGRSGVRGTIERAGGPAGRSPLPLGMLMATLELWP